MDSQVTQDPYWDALCIGCGPEGHTHTNLQCVMWIAQATRMPLAEAKDRFRADHRQTAHNARLTS